MPNVVTCAFSIRAPLEFVLFRADVAAAQAATDRPDDGARPVMITRNAPCWLAISAFDTAEGLWRIVVELVDSGLQTGQLCLIAVPAAMTALRQSDDGTGRTQAILAQLAEDVVEWLGFCDGQSVLATRGPLLAMLRSEVVRTNHAHVSAQADSSGKLSDFKDQIESGSVALAVASSSPAQHAAVTRSLLASSVHRVTTYAFNSSPADPTPDV